MTERPLGEGPRKKPFASMMSKHRRLRQTLKLLTNYGGQRPIVFREALFDVAGHVSPVLAVDSDTGRYYVSTGDRGVSRTVFGRQGAYELDVMAHATMLAGKHVGRTLPLAGRTFVDVGANIGTSTIPALTVFGAADAVAIEPDAENYKLLRCNLVANGIEDRVRTIRIALSDRNAPGLLERDADNWGDHRVRATTRVTDGVFRESMRATVTVPLARFDDVARDLPIDLDRAGMVWMDVQGHEGQVLAGAASLLARDTPVAIEYWPYGLRRAEGLALLHELIAGAYRTVIDIRASLADSASAEMAASEVHRLAERYPGAAYTDLLLLK